MGNWPARHDLSCWLGHKTSTQTKRNFFWNFQQMGKVTRLFCWHQNFVHKGLSAPAPGLYTCGKTFKFKGICLKLATNGRSDKSFLFTWKSLSPRGFLLLPRGYIYMYKIIKNVYKIRFQRDHFETCNIWAKRKSLSVFIKILSPICYLPLPGAIYTWKNMKKTCKDCFKTCNKWTKW